MRTYEVLFILSPQSTEEEHSSLVTDFKGIGEKTGARLVSEEPWGRRRLAYPIQKFNEGIYHLFVFESESALSELDRKMRNSDRVLRHLIVRTDEEMRRAVKLAKKNPKKERIRPAVPGIPGIPGVVVPAEVVAAAPAAEAAVPAEAPVPTPAPTPAPEAATE
jgi:small subunit ribosomal protein S6